MFNLGGAEWIIILIIVLLLFGPGRIGKIAGELGQGLKSFRDSMSGEKKDKASDDTTSSDQPK
jgi:sec-independent protein translocase protein TatA